MLAYLLLAVILCSHDSCGKDIIAGKACKTKYDCTPLPCCNSENKCDVLSSTKCGGPGPAMSAPAAPATKLAESGQKCPCPWSAKQIKDNTPRDYGEKCALCKGGFVSRMNTCCRSEGGGSCDRNEDCCDQSNYVCYYGTCELSYWIQSDSSNNINKNEFGQDAGG